GPTSRRPVPTGSWTRRPSTVTATAAVRRSRSRLQATIRSSPSVHPCTGRTGPRGLRSLRAMPVTCNPSGRHPDRPAHEGGKLAEAVEVDALHARRVGRATQEVALRGRQPERPNDDELLGRLDALGNDERLPALGQVAQRLKNLERGVPHRAALDEREVDLDDVEPR